jgi:hypothetical protein
MSWEALSHFWIRYSAQAITISTAAQTRLRLWVSVLTHAADRW